MLRPVRAEHDQTRRLDGAPVYTNCVHLYPPAQGRGDGLVTS